MPEENDLARPPETELKDDSSNSGKNESTKQTGRGTHKTKHWRIETPTNAKHKMPPKGWVKIYIRVRFSPTEVRYMKLKYDENKTPDEKDRNVRHLFELWDGSILKDADFRQMKSTLFAVLKVNGQRQALQDMMGNNCTVQAPQYIRIKVPFGDNPQGANAESLNSCAEILVSPAN
uniref:Rad60-SLD_2 domain-containing protein n=1 Tax=Bursaphelenchus xylophilus TaxID=6326 RepID=A0A1I7S7Z7_BURXY